MAKLNRVVDAHVHLAKRPLFKNGTLDDLQKSMRRARIARSVIIADGEPGSILETLEAAEALEGVSNLSLAASITMHRPLAPQLRRIRKLHSTGRLAGLKLLPGYQYFYVSDKRLAPLYCFAAENGLPVIVHTGDLYLEGAVRPPLLKYSQPLTIDEAATLNPAVTFIIAHCGNPWMLDAAEVIYKNVNVFADLSGLFIGSPVIQGLKLLKRRLEETFAYVGGAGRFLFGTDWPLVDQKDLLDFLMPLVPKRDRECVFAGNAERLFNFAH